MSQTGQWWVHDDQWWVQDCSGVCPRLVHDGPGPGWDESMMISDESMMISDESGPIGDQTTKLVENTKNNNWSSQTGQGPVLDRSWTGPLHRGSDNKISRKYQKTIIDHHRLDVIRLSQPKKVIMKGDRDNTAQIIHSIYLIWLITLIRMNSTTYAVPG